MTVFDIMRLIIPLTFVLFLWPAGVLAQTPVFDLPVQCQINQDCWVANYVDADPGEPATDFQCGPRTYPDHHGTDFAVADLLTAQTGVDVLAAADGKVLRVRDGVEDKIVTPEEREQLLAEDKGCGNGVFIDHGNGWQSIYCHMKKDSIAVRPEQQVRAGDRLGQIGYSGIAEFPHLHFGVFFENNPVDPFTGLNITNCGANGSPLWSAAAGLEYDPVSIYGTGFKAGITSFEAIKIDMTAPETIAADSDILTFWAALKGVREGDRIILEITDPHGRVFSRKENTQSKTRARQFYYIGRRVQEEGLAKGTYTGNVHLRRAGEDNSVMEKGATSEIKVE